MNGTFPIRNSHFFRFREDDYILENLDANAVKLALNNWEAGKVHETDGNRWNDLGVTQELSSVGFCGVDASFYS